MPKEDEFENAVDPGEPPVVEAPGAEEEVDDFPDAQILVDETTGQTFIAFEVQPQDVIEEEEKEEKE